MTPLRPLRHRVMLAFGAFSVLVTVVFVLLAFVFAYVVEDAYFESSLQREAAAQMRHRADHGRWTLPRDGGVQLHTDPTTFPADLGASDVADRGYSEVAGAAGRHYHVLAFAPGAWLVSDVGAQLMVRPMRQEMLFLATAAACALLLLALGLGAWLARWLTAPLSMLAARLSTLQPDRWAVTFADGTRDDEVGVLARGLDALVRRVSEFMAREQAFTRDASHELRTPITVIRSAADRLSDEVRMDTPVARRQLDHIRNSARQLEATIELLLALAREDSPSVDAGPWPLLPLLEQVVIEQAPLLESRAVEVVVHLARDIHVTWPASVMHSVLGNLVGNAFAHTKGGRVRIDVHDGRLRVVNSQPLDAHMRDTLFEPFARGADSGGHGLGLSIVRRLCDRHGIDLRIDSEGDMTVASFTLTPGACAHGPQANSPV